MLFVEDDGLMGLLLGRHRAIIYQAYRDAIQNAEALPKLPFRKKFSRLFQIGTTDTFSCPTTFIALTNRTGRPNTPSHLHVEAVGRVKPVRHNDRILESNHWAFMPIGSTSYVQRSAYIGPKPAFG